MPDDNKIKIGMGHILITKASLKRRVLRIINDLDYAKENIDRMGYVFGLLDLDLGSQNAKIFDAVSEAVNGYYQNPMDYDVAFDDFINVLNRRIRQIVGEKNIAPDCNIALGVLKDTKMLFCAAGNICAYLHYPQGVKKIFPEMSGEPIDINKKLFPYSLSGELLKNYLVYFCNQGFNGVVNPYFFDGAIKSNGAEKAIEAVKDYLLKQEAGEHYAAFYIYHNLEGAKNFASDALSITDLFRKEQKIAEELSPSLINSAKYFLKEKPLLAYLLKCNGLFFKKMLALIKKAFFFLAFFLFNFFFVITNIRGKRKEKQRVLDARFRRIGYKLFDFYKSLTAVSKIILLSCIILTLVLSGTIAYSLYAQKIKNLKLGYKEKIVAVERLYTEAETGLIFQQKNDAALKLKEAAEILEAAPKEIRDNDYKTLAQKIKTQLYEIQNISEINSPVILADFSSEKNTQVFPPFYLDKNQIYSFSKNELISIDAKNQTIRRNNFTIRGLPGGLALYYAPKGLIYSIENGSAVQEASPTLLTSNLKEVVLNSNEAIKFFALYNDAMYALSVVEKHFSIWKHGPSLSGFGKPTLWITDNPPEGSLPVSLAVDSNLYVLFSNNQINKYYHGQKSAWKYYAGNVPGKDVAYHKIIANENYKYIYLLDKKWVSIVSKDGEFLAHYYLPEIESIRDGAIDEVSKTIYLLGEKKIYAFSYNL